MPNFENPVKEVDGVPYSCLVFLCQISFLRIRFWKYQLFFLCCTHCVLVGFRCQHPPVLCCHRRRRCHSHQLLTERRVRLCKESLTFSADHLWQQASLQVLLSSPRPNPTPPPPSHWAACRPPRPPRSASSAPPPVPPQWVAGSAAGCSTARTSARWRTRGRACTPASPTPSSTNPDVAVSS